VQHDRLTEGELVHAGELRHELADRRLDVQEGVGARDLGELDRAGERDGGSASVSCTPPRRATPAAPASPAMRFIGGSLKARATRIERGGWKTSAVGPYWSTPPASRTAVGPPSSSAWVGSVVA